MEQYKLINAELMDQVQLLRITNAEMLKTEIVLKRQLMEERELRIADAQYHEQKLKCAIRTLLHSLNVNLCSHECSLTSQSSNASENVRSSSYNNGQVCSELRRSSGILQRALPVSPTRRSRSSVSSCKTSQDEASESSTTTMSPGNYGIPIARKTPEPRHLMELNMSSPEVEGQESAEQLSPSVAHIYSISEESDSEDNTLASSMESNETLQRSSAYGSTIDISPLPPINVTNNHKRALLVPRVEITEERSPSKNTQNETEKCNLRQKRITKLILDHLEPDVGSQEPRIENIGYAVQARSPLQMTLPRTSTNTDALTPRRALTDMTNRPVGHSTPHKQKQLFNTKCSPVPSQTDESSMEDSRFGRPRRSCRPSSLKEPDCRSKLRNKNKTK
ncbi:PREDICTED: shugoshin-like [Drosophila arizonae]|uniref:Shugoshin-like n=1 Tax=Drosophila arizonae TaxID=7263 RepID=A0ABM1PJR3_DROAR|nr:PREDICTED: shugoshin-like [Drosophila arizonae]XP_017867450.1 PREDICTED: shugoshin-like [Drosophila arizonae]